MSLSIDRSRVGSGVVSFLATNEGSIRHELVILPLTDSQVAGSRPTSSENKVDETASLGEASATCNAGEGSGIAPGSAGWVTLNLAPGRYEIVCNLPGHYAAGMYQKLIVS
ncbi:sulfocyanin-like copper-binding protein [Cryobacterium sp. 10I1]|uniref:sulfocyanin-like copper-binding protein n=1 Tax=unclassified Cryobacterium TaxID=2649013 RepID=UPI002AC98DB7|nr:MULTISPECIES: sulfocyanin-like copper-binding protein [unclassified Cryobacterium]MEB0286948.1 sulfocyanin-like copper-binding protein [Cryobacterium sp. 10S3]MEB0305696.1 sulfocyanin-like copper-binding protein [Cryobacterium sp. 10I1]WPX15604.1 sulfocyanin-like copper-binding protein [Cryobacterium sp. 10S3]